MNTRTDATNEVYWGDADDEVALERYRTLVETIDDGICYLDPDGTVVAVNEALVEMTGYHRDELVGEHVSLVLAADDVARLEREISRRIEPRDDAVVSVDLLARAVDGASVPLELRVNPVTDDGEFLGTIVVARVRSEPTREGIREGEQIREGTESRTRERELKRFERMVETVDDGVYVTDHDGRFVFVNDAFVAMSEHSREELLGAHGSLFFGDRFVDTDEEEWRKLVDGECDSIDFETEVTGPNGETRTVQNRFVTLEIGTERGRVGVTRDVTERKAYERELERYETVVETVGDGVYLLDGNHEFTMVNSAFASMTGYDRDELVGSHAETVFGEKYVEVANAKQAEMEDTGSSVAVFEEELYPATGDPLIVESRFTLFEFADDEQGRIGTVRDVSDRVAYERELEQYETIVETVDDGIYVVDEQGRFTMVNDAYAEMTGYSRAELLGSHVSLVADDETIERAREAEREMATGTAEGPIVEASLRTADGRSVPAEATFSMLSDDHRERVGVVRDISDRKARERALEESERLYRTLAENFPNGAVGLYDEELIYTAAGGELLEEFGIPTDDIVGTSIPDLFPTALFEEVERSIRAVFDGESNSFETEYQGRNLLSQSLPVRNADDEVYAGMLVTQDITEREEYRRKLEASNERLEQFAYVASHDLQEPLRMVTSYLQLLETRYGDALDEDGEEFLAFAVDGAERMREMIDGLLEYSRVDTRGDPFEPVDLNDVLESVLHDLQLRIDERDARITTEDLPRIEGDASQVRQVFQNLLSNAITYSGDDPPVIDIAAEREGEAWKISVRDEGIGIDPDHADRVFEVFQRLHSHEEYPGTGIGLALCKRIVDRHGGEIWVDSESGDGTTISFTLPAVHASRGRNASR
nr:PAS domain S-box protein [Natrinema caseinilyticum]